MGEQRLRLAEETLKLHPALRRYVGRTVVVGIRPEDLEDASMASDFPTDERIHGKLVLREALGRRSTPISTIEAPPVLTEDKGAGRGHRHDHQYEAHSRELSTTTKMVGRFNARTQVARARPSRSPSTCVRSTSSI